MVIVRDNDNDVEAVALTSTTSLGTKLSNLK